MFYRTRSTSGDSGVAILKSMTVQTPKNYPRKATMQNRFGIESGAVIACQQYAGSYPRLASSSGAETWQLVAGLEAALILVLFAGWLHATRTTPQKRDGEGDESP